MDNTLKFPGPSPERTPIKETSKILKNARGYGTAVLDRMYTAIYKAFFEDYGVEGMPDRVPWTFTYTGEYLGKFHCKVEFEKDADGEIVGISFSDPSIELSNSFDLTPEQMGNVIAHEMIHLFQVAQLADDPDPAIFRGVSEDTVVEQYLGHGFVFDDLAKEINEELGLGVTAKNDLPLIKNRGVDDSAGDYRYYVFIQDASDPLFGNSNSTLVGLPREGVAAYLDEHPGDRDNAFVYRSADNSFNAVYANPDRRHGRKSLVYTAMIWDYANNGVLEDVTVEFIPEYGYGAVETETPDGVAGGYDDDDDVDEDGGEPPEYTDNVVKFPGN